MFQDEAHEDVVEAGRREGQADLRTAREPELARAGGFRLDDPQGEVGIEFMVVTDGSGGRLIVRVNRILQPDGGVAPDGGAGQPCISATWRLPDGTGVRGAFACARYVPARTA
jgi:hypothetical protein